MNARTLLMLTIAGIAGTCIADDDTPAPVQPQKPLTGAQSTPPAAAPIRRIDAAAGDRAGAEPGGKAEDVRFTSEARWEIAGYNNEEIVFTILITNHDSRILRCTTQIRGSYFEDGRKLSIEDRQTTTVFPDTQGQAGNWLGMDQASGATYSVQCKPV